MAESVILRSSASPKNASPTSASPSVKASGPLPIVQITMGGNGAAKLNDGTPRNVTVGLVRGGIRRDGKMVAPQLVARALPAPAAVPSFVPDQLMLCRHLVGEYLKTQEAIFEGEEQEGQEDARATAIANAELAKSTIASIDIELSPPAKPVSIIDHRPQVGANRRIGAPRGDAPPPVVVSMNNGAPQIEG